MLSATQPRGPRVGGWELGRTIGVGSTGKVKMATRDGQVCAVKIVRCSESERVRVKKEIAIHGCLSHPNIIRLMDVWYEDSAAVYISMELAAGGELFDKIAPDVGVGEQLAQLYFAQLVAGVAHMHAHGIAHRDLKPENLLLDARGNLKIADFGLASCFRHRGVVRLLAMPCGSPPYVAPEVQALQYRGPPVDVWSSGIILFALLAGNTPWAEPTKHDADFSLYLHHYSQRQPPPAAPWNAFSPPVLQLLLGILNPDPDLRWTLTCIQDSAWSAIPNPLIVNGECDDPAAIAACMIDKLTGAGELELLDPAPPYVSNSFTLYSRKEVTHVKFSKFIESRTRSQKPCVQTTTRR